jgi:hypothetical protein
MITVTPGPGPGFDLYLILVVLDYYPFPKKLETGTHFKLGLNGFCSGCFVPEDLGVKIDSVKKIAR